MSRDLHTYLVMKYLCFFLIFIIIFQAEIGKLYVLSLKSQHLSAGVKSKSVQCINYLNIINLLLPIAFAEKLSPLTEEELNPLAKALSPHAEKPNTLTEKLNPYTEKLNPYPEKLSPHAKKPSTSAKKQKKQTLLLEKGESIKLSSPFFEKVWLSKPGIVSISDQGSSLRVQAKKEGEVLLSLDSRLYLIQVLNEKQKKNMKALNDFLSNRMGLKARLIKEHIHIQGELYRVKDFIDLSRITKALNLNYRFSAEVAPNFRPKLQNYIYKNIETLSHPILLWEKPLTALVPDENSLKNLYQTKLKPFGITVKPDPSLLPTPPLVKIKVLLVESSNNHSFGTHIDWGEKTINRLLDGSLFKDILSTFKAMEDKGQAQILSSAVLLSESGKESYFHSGGEVPIPHFNPESGTQGIKWKPYGIRLNFNTKVDQTEKINIKAHVNISEVDHAHSARSAPSLKSSNINTSITMKNGQSLLLSKLIRRQKGKSRSAPAEIFRLPLAGPLLSFKGKIKEHTRLNIFITTFLLKTNQQ